MKQINFRKNEQCLVPRTEAKHKIKTKVKVEIKTEIKQRKKKKLKQLNKNEKMKLILMKQLNNQEKYCVAINDQNKLKLETISF